jgi:anti-sigma B factor antagonist
MKLAARVENGVMVLKVKGKIMGAPDEELFRSKLSELAQQNKRQVVVDLAGLEWINSKGVGILISGLTTMRNNDGELKLACVSKKVKSLLELTRIITLFEDYETVEEAVKSFG